MIPKTRLGKRSPFGSLVSETGKTSIPMAKEAGQLGISRVKGHADLKYGGGEASGVLIQLDASDQPPPYITSLLPASRAFDRSSCINVPKSQRNRPEVDMDELMAAMVLSSLSCSPLPPPQSSAHREAAAPSMDCGGAFEFSDSGSSGYWSVGHAPESPASSSPVAEPDSGTATPPDEGLDMELDQVLFEDPAPRKRRNSLKMAYRCLWPSCEKVLTSVVGIKRHIKTTHLCHGSEHEEDFYYTEINQRQSSPTSPPSSPSLPPSPPPPSPPSPPTFTCSVLSRSAPSPTGSFWQVQSEHSYQALPPTHVVSLAAPPTTCSRQGVAFRVRSVSVGEQWLQNHNTPCRRIRNEAKKCRKVYGIEHRELWCTACRWKKACQRFLD
ncbi:zinc finger protein 395 [Nematolebias whitei]|uniref:zinc finger protein 395 n=1 Tax=Nematolebias whitei TaxID=451745 RepID=UPI00189A131A|nr:zinc finger protein 395 [Nematolebias whitei]XP_037553659.1 zinc finger protein 395 [Nematolebias whitei]